MTTISDLPWDLVEEILIKIPLTCLGKVRSTCKRWNSSSKNRILCKTEARQQFLGFMANNFRVRSVRFDFDGIGEGLVESNIKQIDSLVNHVEVRDIYLCDGLLLCVTRDNTSLIVWNPYLGQTRWVQPRSEYHILDRYALGYDNNNNRNHKIFRYLRVYDYQAQHLILTVECEIYDFQSDSWKVLDVPPGWDIVLDEHGALLNGNAYFFCGKHSVDEEYGSFLLCFDFTKESFGQFLHLPRSDNDYDTRKLSSLNEEKLAVLFEDDDAYEVDIWVTSKIEPTAVLWTKFLKFKTNLFFGIASFFIEEEKKLALVFDVDFTCGISLESALYYNKALINGENGCLKEVDLGEAVDTQKYLNGNFPVPNPVAYSSSYVPSLVQINQINGGG